MGNIKTFRIVLGGRVQGVGYRYYVEEKAGSFGIKGYVKNTSEDKVEVVCQGFQDKLEQFIQKVKKGPAFSRVDSFVIEEIKGAYSYSSFQIKY